MIDTYWSDHCRHTTFGTHIWTTCRSMTQLMQAAYERYLAAARGDLRPRQGRSPSTLMDMATIGAKALKAARHAAEPGRERGDQRLHRPRSQCDGRRRGCRTGCCCSRMRPTTTPPRSSPSAARPPASAAAIRDPLSGRSLRLSGHARDRRGRPADACLPRRMPGKLPQRKLVTTAAAGYSTYGNQIGLATGQVAELYHPGYVAKRMEIGAVVGAAPASQRPPRGPRPRRCGHPAGRPHRPRRHRRRHRLLQGPQAEVSLETCGAEVQKGNAPEERKLQRLFRNERCHPPHQALQRLRRRRRLRCHRRAGRRPGDRPERRPEEVRRSGRHRAGHLRDPRSAWPWSWPPRMPRRSSRAAARGKPGSLPVVAVVTEEAAHGHELERQGHRRPHPRVPELQRRREARRRARGASSGHAWTAPAAGAPSAKTGAPGLRPERLPPEGPGASASTPPSARPRC